MRTDNFVRIIGQAGFEQVRDEIDARRPVGARIGWSGGGGHFMVIYGYSFVGGTQYFDIDDPIYGARAIFQYRIFPLIIRGAEPGRTPISPRKDMSECRSSR